MARSIVTNVTQGALTLPFPYTRVIAPGKSAVVPDSVAAIIALLGGDQAIDGVCRVEHTPDSGPDVIAGTAPSSIAPGTNAALGVVTVTTLNGLSVLAGAADPTAGGGVAATRPAIYTRTGTDQVYLKTGAGNTAWTRLGTTADLATYLPLGARQRVFPAGFLPTKDTGGPVNVASGTCGALYVGDAQRDMTSIDVHTYIHGVAAEAGAGGDALNWAEIGIAIGTFENYAGRANTDLTIKGYASFDAEARTAATAVAAKSIGGIQIPAGSGLWIVIASAYETLPANYRYVAAHSPIIGEWRKRAATRPSLNLDVPLTFAAANEAIPMLWALDL